jgi:Flp pilus assembly pilin Flp
MKDLLRRFATDTEGQDLIEYALLSCFFAVEDVHAITAIFESLNTLYQNIGTQVTAAGTAAAGS